MPFPSPGHLPTQRLSLHLLRWQADSLPHSHLGSPSLSFLSSNSAGWLTHMHRAIALAQARRAAAPKCFLISVQLCLTLQIRVPPLLICPFSVNPPIQPAHKRKKKTQLHKLRKNFLEQDKHFRTALQEQRGNKITLIKEGEPSDHPHG